MPFRKQYDSAAAAIADLGDGATVLIGGVGPGGEPAGLLDALLASGVRGLTVVCDLGDDGDWVQSESEIWMAGLVEAGVITRLIAPALPGVDDVVALEVEPGQRRPLAVATWSSGPLAIAILQRGGLAVEMVPRGALAERLRAAGAGIGGVFVPAASVGVFDGGNEGMGLETRTINGVECVLLPPLRADFALLRADCADTMGNLAYRGAQRGWNAVMAAAARITVVEADTIGEPGVIDPELVITPGIYVNRIVAAKAGVNADANAAGYTG